MQSCRHLSISTVTVSIAIPGHVGIRKNESILKTASKMQSIESHKKSPSVTQCVKIICSCYIVHTYLITNHLLSMMKYTPLHYTNPEMEVVIVRK